MFLTGPKVVKTVTGEDVNEEQLGGASVHSSKSGVAHFAVDTEEDGIRVIRDLLGYLPQNNLEEPPLLPTGDPIDRLEDSLNEIVPDSPNKPYDMYEVIGAIVDDGKFLEVHKDYATNMIVGFGRFNGISVGIVANQPKVLAVSSIITLQKRARFVRFCDHSNHTSGYLVDVPDSFPGNSRSYGGIIFTAQTAYDSERQLPKVTITLRKSTVEPIV